MAPNQAPAIGSGVIRYRITARQFLKMIEANAKGDVPVVIDGQERGRIAVKDILLP